MADNVGYTPGEGAQIAADEIAGVLHQRAKVQFGEDGSATDVSAANPLPVAVGGVSTEATLSALKTSVDALNAKIAALEGGRMPVVLPAGSSGLTNTELRDSPVPVSNADVEDLLRRAITLLMSPRGYDKSMARQRVTANIENLPTLATVTTVGNIGQIAGRDGVMLINPTNRTSWALNHRSRIS